MNLRCVQLSVLFALSAAVCGCGGSEEPKPAASPAAPAAKAEAKPEAKPAAKPTAKKGGLQSSNEELPGRER